MLSVKVYINGIGAIAPQSPDCSAANNVSFPFLKCTEPDYTGIIEPNRIRRMSRLLKLSLVAAKKAAVDANATTIDAIITGTGLGCIEDTEKFLKGIINEEGSAFSPTAFIHSTHNTISSQIAIELNCTGYNSTYVHRALSFESALMDAIIQFNEGSQQKEKNILVGGVDEITPTIYDITNQLNFWKKKEEIAPLYKSATKGAIAGEGMVYFSLSNKISTTTYAQIIALQLFRATSDLNACLLQFIKENKLELSDIDLLVLGTNGDDRFDFCYHEIAKLFNKDTTVAYYKNLCGEYFTSSAFGLAFSALAISKNYLSEAFIIQGSGATKFKKAIVYNQFMGVNHCFYLLSNV